MRGWNSSSVNCGTQRTPQITPTAAPASGLPSLDSPEAGAASRSLTDLILPTAVAASPSHPPLCPSPGVVMQYLSFLLWILLLGPRERKEASFFKTAHSFTPHWSSFWVQGSQAWPGVGWGNPVPATLTKCSAGHSLLGSKGEAVIMQQPTALVSALRFSAPLEGLSESALSFQAQRSGTDNQDALR